MLNRAAVILKYREPAIAWINGIEPDDQDFVASPELVNKDRLVYLISEEDAADEEALADWIERNYLNLFETELEGWYTDQDAWPENLSLGMFYDWFEVECHSALVDTVGSRIFDDEV